MTVFDLTILFIYVIMMMRVRFSDLKLSQQEMVIVLSTQEKATLKLRKIDSEAGGYDYRDNKGNEWLEDYFWGEEFKSQQCFICDVQIGPGMSGDRGWSTAAMDKPTKYCCNRHVTIA